ncbi:MAG: dethiobiotin synthase [Legionella sp.]|nr:MAG: dethiobiotin synthase [Legionella sp.]
MQRYFIIGTDTNCGKTYVTACLLDYFPQSLAIKPVASGVVEFEGELISSDAHILHQHCQLDLQKINPWLFKSPVSPHIAAKEQGIEVSASDIVDYCLQQPFDTDLLFIEGAGGLEVPLNDVETWVDVLKLSQIPVILVVGIKLGCINHALLTARSLAVNGIECVGWIANCIDPQMLALHENIDTLNNKLPFPCLTVISHGEEIKTLFTLQGSLCVI